MALLLIHKAKLIEFMALFFIHKTKLMGSMVLLLVYQFVKSWNHCRKAASHIMLGVKLVPRLIFYMSQSRETLLAKVCCYKWEQHFHSLNSYNRLLFLYLNPEFRKRHFLEEVPQQLFNLNLNNLLCESWNVFGRSSPLILKSFLIHDWVRMCSTGMRLSNSDINSVKCCTIKLLTSS